MARSRLGNKGYILILVVGVMVVAASAISTLMVFLRGRAEDLEILEDRTKAQYLCETAASYALVDFSNGKVPEDWKTVSFPVGNRSYLLNYRMTKHMGMWQVESSVESPLGLKKMKYGLIVKGNRAFPFFIKGLGAGL